MTNAPADAEPDAAPETGPLPLHGLRVVEFTHVVAGPLIGLVLADLGADVLRVEPPGGEPTRRLGGFGAGFHDYYNRGKRAVALDLKTDAGLAEARRLVAGADVLVENYAPGVMERLGLGYAACAKTAPTLVYCSLKGFLDGPYAHRVAVDEVVQMMGGLAYMTGPPGRPLRAGTSALDITAGLFAVIAVQAALRERERTGRGQHVRAGLYESSAFLVGQFMAALRPDREPPPPMPARANIWPLYQLFGTADGRPVFLAVVSDRHWRATCAAFGWADLAADAELATHAGRVRREAGLVAEVRHRLAALPYEEVVRRCAAHNLPYAEVRSPAELAGDEHLVGGGHLVELGAADGHAVPVPGLPIELGGRRPSRAGRAPGLPEA